MALAGFSPLSGKDFTTGDESEIAKRLQQFGEKFHVTVYGISGYRTPAKSVAVGGNANDPHTKGAAADIGINEPTIASVDNTPDIDAKLASVGLYRPYKNLPNEGNHIELKPGGGGIVGTVTGAVGDAAGAVGGAVSGAVDAVTHAPSEVAKDLVGDIWGSVKDDGTRALMYALFVFAGTALAVAGIARATGVGQRRSNQDGQGGGGLPGVVTVGGRGAGAAPALPAEGAVVGVASKAAVVAK